MKTPRDLTGAIFKRYLVEAMKKVNGFVPVNVETLSIYSEVH